MDGIQPSVGCLDDARVALGLAFASEVGSGKRYWHRARPMVVLIRPSDSFFSRQYGEFRVLLVEARMIIRSISMGNISGELFLCQGKAARVNTKHLYTYAINFIVMNYSIISFHAVGSYEYKHKIILK